MLRTTSLIATAILLTTTIGIAPAQEAPRVIVDPFWPKPLPNKWILGQIGGVAVDSGHFLAEEAPERVIVLVSSTDPRELSPLARSSGAAALLRKHWLTPRLLRGLWVAHRRR